MTLDPIADLLTRIRNAIMVGKRTVNIPASKLKIELLKILMREGYIRKFIVEEDGKQGLIRVLLKYKNSLPAIQGLERVSTPGRRFYTGHDTVPRVLNGLGIAVVSTSKGLLTDKEAKNQKYGGEVLCKVW